MEEESMREESMREETLRGSFYDIGRQYGHLFKKEIKQFSFMTRLMAIVGEGEGRDFFRPKWYHIPGALLKLKKSREKYRTIAGEFEENIVKFYPQLIEMIKGMAETTSIEYKELIFMNCMAEYSLKCSTLGAAGNSTEKGFPILAMNADESKFVERYEVILNIEPNRGYKFKGVYMAGAIFPNFAINEHGLGVVSELLFLDNPGVKKLRVPMLLKFSIIHSCKSVEEAESILDNIPPSGIGSVIYVADKDKMLVIEENSLLKDKRVVENGYHFNTNLPRSKKLQIYDNRENKGDIVFFFAHDRERRLKNLFKKYDGKLNEDLFYSFISDHGSLEDGTLNRSICIHPENTKGIKTCTSCIISPVDKSIRIYKGNPCNNEVVEFKFL